MNELEKHMRHKVIVNMMKQAIDNNPILDSVQKDQQKARVDACAAQADRIEDVLLMIRYLGL